MEHISLSQSKRIDGMNQRVVFTNEEKEKIYKVIDFYNRSVFGRRLPHFFAIELQLGQLSEQAVREVVEFLLENRYPDELFKDALNNPNKIIDPAIEIMRSKYDE